MLYQTVRIAQELVLQALTEGSIFSEPFKVAHGLGEGAQLLSASVSNRELILIFYTQEFGPARERREDLEIKYSQLN